MIDPRYSRSLPVSTSSGVRRNLPTGKNFSGSSLSPIQRDKLVFSVITDSISISDPSLVSIPQSAGYCKRSATANEAQSPLIIEAGKILVIALWFWCLIGANFCFDTLSTIISQCLQDI